MTTYQHELTLTENGFKELKTNLTRLAKDKPDSWWYGHGLLNKVNQLKSNVLSVNDLQFELVTGTIDPIEILKINSTMLSTNSCHIKNELIIEK